MLKSKLKPYSIGLVLEDKKPDSDILVVQPTEALTNKSGDLTVYEHQHGDITGNNRLECIWLDFTDIRSTAPDMVTGEKVQLWRYENTDMYYWFSIGRSNPLRRLEHIEWLLSNTAERAEDPKPDNQLFILATTRDGYLQIITPQNRKEKALFNIKADFKEGLIKFTDGNGGEWSWDTVAGKIKLKAREVYWDVPKVTFNSKVNILKGLLVRGSTSLRAGASILGNVSVRGAVKVKGIVKAFLFKHF